MEEAADETHILASLDMDSNQYSCPICSAHQFSRSTLLYHLTSCHADHLVAMCKVCSQYFPSDEIESHAVRCKGVHACPYCRSTFAVASYLRRHITRQHTNFSPSICDICGKSLSSTTALTAHKRLHTGEMPHSCELCGARYPQKCHLKLHIESHHAHEELRSAEKSYVCKGCNRRFLFASSLQHHCSQRSKTLKRNFMCPCENSLAYYSRFEEHCTNHSKRLALHQCSLCPRSFTRASLLRAHLLRHSDPDRLTCEYCLRRYSSRAYLDHHIQKKHLHDRELPKTSSISSFDTNCGSDSLSSLTDSACINTHAYHHAPMAADVFLTTLEQEVTDELIEETVAEHDSFLDEVLISGDSESLHLPETTPNVNYLYDVLYGTIK